MSLKNILSVAVVAALTAGTAMAQPTIDVADGGLNGSGNREFIVSVAPGTDGNSLAVELGFETEFGSNILSATSNADWEDDGVAPVGNPGNNPFSGTVTDGIVVDGTTVFAALGSTNLVTGSTAVLTIELDSAIDVLQLGQTAASIIAEDGANNSFGPTEFGVFGDFDTDGDVDIVDFGTFGAGFNADPPEFDIVDFGDFGLNFGLDATPGSGSAVPEPTTMVLGLLSMIGLAATRRSRS